MVMIVTELEALKMVPAYLVPAGIVLWLGAKALAAKDKLNEDLCRSFSASVEKIHSEHRQDIDGILARFWQIQGEWKTEVKGIIEDYMQITRETILAVKGLEESVRELKDFVGLRNRQIADITARRGE